MMMFDEWPRLGFSLTAAHLLTFTAASCLARRQDESAMRELQERKQEYMQQLRALEQNLKSAKSGDTNAGIVPANTRINFSMETNHSNQSLDMVCCCCWGWWLLLLLWCGRGTHPLAHAVQVIGTNNDTLIKCILVFAFDGGLFDGESLVVYPSSPTCTLTSRALLMLLSASSGFWGFV